MRDTIIPAAIDLKSLTGKGVTAQLHGETIWIGKPEMFGVDGVAPLGDETPLSSLSCDCRGEP